MENSIRAVLGGCLTQKLRPTGPSMSPFPKACPNRAQCAVVA